MKLFGLNIIPHSSHNKEMLKTLSDIKDKVQDLDMIIPSAQRSAMPMDYNEATPIPFDRYRQIGYLVKCRSVSSKDDILFKEKELESLAMQCLKQKDFDTNEIIFVAFENGGIIYPHYHEFSEEYIVVSGVITVSMDDKKLTKGDRIFVEPYKVHKLFCHEHGIAIIKKPKR